MHRENPNDNMEILDGLLYLTSQRLEYPRLTPSNILVTGRGEVKIGTHHSLQLKTISNCIWQVLSKNVLSSGKIELHSTLTL